VLFTEKKSLREQQGERCSEDKATTKVYQTLLEGIMYSLGLFSSPGIEG
jgi:hypothetical protein